MTPILSDWPSESIPFLIITFLILTARFIITLKAKKDFGTSTYTRLNDNIALFAIPLLMIVLLFIIFNADWGNISNLF